MSAVAARAPGDTLSYARAISSGCLGYERDWPFATGAERERGSVLAKAINNIFQGGRQWVGRRTGLALDRLTVGVDI